MQNTGQFLQQNLNGVQKKRRLANNKKLKLIVKGTKQSRNKNYHKLLSKIAETLESSKIAEYTIETKQLVK